MFGGLIVIQSRPDSWLMFVHGKTRPNVWTAELSALFEINVWPKSLSKTCQSKGLWSASLLTWSMLIKLLTLPPLKHPVMALGASEIKFYKFGDTRSVSLTVNCYSDVQKCPQKHWHCTDFPAIFAAVHIKPQSISGSI